MPRKNLISLHEAIVITLINSPTRTASFEEIAKYIVSRNLYPIRKGNISLDKQVMLRSTKSKGNYKYLFDELGAGYIRLRDTNASFPVLFYSALESLLDYDRNFYTPPAKLLSVVVRSLDSKETLKFSLSPKEVVCITSPNKSRNKEIYFLEKESETIKCVNFNNNKFNFDKLCSFLDPTSNYLTNISKSAIVNVAFFDLIGKKLLKYIGPQVSKNILPEIKISARNGAEINLKEFKLIKESYKRRCFLQKVAIGYKTEMGFE